MRLANADMGERDLWMIRINLARLPRTGRRLSLQTRHYGESLDLVIDIGLQESVIVPERHAAI
jgi:hypothetical protein